ncbi:MAG: ATP-binding protein [Bacteroidota bacterium]
MKIDQLFETHNFATIMNACDDAQTNKRMIAIYGYPGAGKTSGLIQYARVKKNVYYLRVRKSMTDKDFYRALLGVLGFKDVRNELSIHYLMNKLSNNLNMVRSNNLLIIDEAGKLKPRQLEYIHELRDLTQSTTGIVLAGPDYFSDNLDNWKEKGVIGIPELVRRIQASIELDPVTLDEVREICKHYGITQKRMVKYIKNNSENFSDVMNHVYRELLKRKMK